MTNYFSKFSLQEMGNQKHSINRLRYRKAAAFLTLILYVLIFLVVSIHIDSYLTNIIVKAIIIILGFGLHVYMQFKLSKSLTQNPTQPTSSNELVTILKRYEPKIYYFALFLGLYFVSPNVKFPIIIINFIVLVVSLIHLYFLLKKDNAI